MKQLIYLSSAVNLMNNDELAGILKISRKNNHVNGLTGILLYSDGTFIQVLEGEDKQVDTTFQKIALDERHRNIITLIELSTDKRDFPEWLMGFTTMSADKYKDLEGYLTHPKEMLNNSHASAAITVLKTFIKTNHLMIS